MCPFLFLPVLFWNPASYANSIPRALLLVDGLLLRLAQIDVRWVALKTPCKTGIVVPGVRGEVPRGFTLVSQDLVLEVRSCLKRTDPKFRTKQLKPGGGVPWKNVFFGRFDLFGLALFWRVYCRCVLLHNNQTLQTSALVNRLQLCEGSKTYNETHVTYSSVKTPSRSTFPTRVQNVSQIDANVLVLWTCITSLKN